MYKRQVYGTKPYVYNGQLIEGWHVTFKDGKVVEHGAEKHASLLAELLSTCLLYTSARGAPLTASNVLRMIWSRHWVST